MLEFLKGPFFVQHFSYYKLMTFLMVLSVMLLSMVMILPSTLRVIKHWLLNLNLIYEALSTGAESDLLISMLENLSWFHLTGLVTLVLLMWEWRGPSLTKNHFLRYWVWLSLLNWIGALTLSLLLKLPPRKWSLDSFIELSLSWVCSISLYIYHMAMHGILLSCLGWSS